MTKYARDEFDKVPETSSRQGVHRVASEPPRRRLGPILAVGIAALAIGVVAFLFLPTLGFSAAGNPSTLAAGSSASSPAASPSVEASQAASPPSATSSAAPSADASANTSPSALATTGTDAPDVDKSQPIAVYNGTTTSGLASRVGGSVSAAGWTLGPVGNWGGMPQKTSVIYYSGEAQKGNAEALGSLLNITSIVDSAEFQMPVVVVLGPGFQ